MSPGSLAAFGYTEKRIDVEHELQGILIVNPRALIVDTRLTPWCNWSAVWRREQLEVRYGQRYYWRGDWLGNVNHASGGPVQLADAARGLSWLVSGLTQGWTLILLCGCADYTRCHRRVIYEQVQAHLGLPTYTHGQRVQTPYGRGEIDAGIPLDVQRARNLYAVKLSCPCYHYPRLRGVPGVRYVSPQEIRPIDGVHAGPCPQCIGRARTREEYERSFQREEVYEI